MKLGKVFVIILGLLLFLILMFGCGDRIILRPDVYINYSHRYDHRYDYGTYYNYSTVVIQNSTGSYIEPALDGKKLLPKRIPPGQEEGINIEVSYGERRNIVLTASCYNSTGKLIGTSYRTFSFSGRADEKRSEIWLISDCRNP